MTGIKLCNLDSSLGIRLDKVLNKHDIDIE